MKYGVRGLNSKIYYPINTKHKVIMISSMTKYIKSLQNLNIFKKDTLKNKWKHLEMKIFESHLSYTYGAIFLLYSMAAIIFTRRVPTFNEHFDLIAKWRRPIKASKQQNMERNSIRVYEDETNALRSPKNELRIIVLGDIGSRKKSKENSLLKETKRTTLRTLTIEKAPKTYKIDIINTPPILDNKITDPDVQHELQTAIALSAPGPHAFLLCISDTANPKCYIDALRSYEQYFGDILYDYTIFGFTENDQSMSDGCDEHIAMKKKIKLSQNTELDNMTQFFLLCNETNEYEQIIDIINETKKRKETLGQEVFASCELSEHAEAKLQEAIQTIRKRPRIKEFSRDRMKTSASYRHHFSRQNCKFCQTLKKK